jgi:hypothetical protein
MRMRTVAAAVAALLLSLSGCASAARGPLRVPPRVAGPLPGARAEFEPDAFEGVFREAVRTLRERGFRILACDPDRGAIVTASAEVDAPCHGTTCLARETASVKLGYRRARVVVSREIWDATLRRWREADDRASAAALLREERELVAAAVRVRRVGAWPWDDACTPDACDPGRCLVASSGAVASDAP